MGDPRKPRKKYSTPGHPWQKARIDEETALIKEYGLKNKTEIWKMSSILKKAQVQSKKLIVTTSQQGELERVNLLKKLQNIGLITTESTVDDILGLTINNILERRLQTILVRKGLARTMKQARQMITHGHIVVSEIKVTSPSYIVSVSEESTVEYIQKSSFSNPDHPERNTEEKSK